MFLELRDVKKSFGDRLVLDNISLCLQAGESLLIQGPSGCGKTTLLRCIALLETVDEGEISFKGRVIAANGRILVKKEEIWKGMAMVFQHLYLWNHLSILENVSLPLILSRGKEEGAAQERAIDLLTSLGIDGDLGASPVNLSGGQRQRVAVARALILEPDLLLLDEITANLDRETAVEVLQSVGEVLQQGTATLTVSHSDWIPGSLRQRTLSLAGAPSSAAKQVQPLREPTWR